MNGNPVVTNTGQTVPEFFELTEEKNGVMSGFKQVVFKDVMACMCTGCKLMFPIVAIVHDFSSITIAQAKVVSQGCQIHNSLVLKNMKDC
ncbi:MAG: hypothetical protein IH840_16740 [Candidatus Heimdallarchaeota archaeon]|nr:hypothetical protein [Candidatus Heimdallarchaeota archaeon]